MPQQLLYYQRCSNKIKSTLRMFYEQASPNDTAKAAVHVHGMREERKEAEAGVNQATRVEPMDAEGGPASTSGASSELAIFALILALLNSLLMHVYCGYVATRIYNISRSPFHP